MAKERGTVKRIMGNASWLFVEAALSRLLSFLLVIYLARRLGSINFGKLTFANAFVQIFLTKYEWKDQIDYEINLSQPQGGMGDFRRAKLTPRPLGQKEAGAGWKRWLKSWILKALRLLWLSHPWELLDILACPECKGSLQKKKIDSFAINAADTIL